MMKTRGFWEIIPFFFAFCWTTGAQEEHSLGNSTVFKLFVEEGSFSNAEQRCASLSLDNNTFDFTLARIDSEEEFNFVVDQFNLGERDLPETVVSGLTRESIWIGLKRLPEITTSFTHSTDNFTFIDGVEANIDFFAEDRNFPWDGTQPNNFDGSQHCVSWELLPLLGVNGLNQPRTWYDDNCQSLMSAFLCRGEYIASSAPTPDPTEEGEPPESTKSPTDVGEDDQMSPNDEEDDTSGIIFLSIAAFAGTLMGFLVLFILREKKDLKSLRAELEVLESRDNDATVDMLDETDVEIHKLL